MSRNIVFALFIATASLAIADRIVYVTIAERRYAVRGNDIRIFQDPFGRINLVWVDGRTLYDNRANATAPLRQVPIPAPAQPAATPVPVRRAELAHPEDAERPPIASEPPPSYSTAPVSRRAATPAPVPAPAAPVPPAPAPPAPPPTPTLSPEEVERRAEQERELITAAENDMACPVPDEILEELAEKKHPEPVRESRPLNEQDRVIWAEQMASNEGIGYYLYLKAGDPTALRTLTTSSTVVRKVRQGLKRSMAIVLWRSAPLRPLLKFEGMKHKTFSADTLDLLRLLERIAFDKLVQRAQNPDQF